MDDDPDFKNFKDEQLKFGDIIRKTTSRQINVGSLEGLLDGMEDDDDKNSPSVFKQKSS
jgi:hypothetical protein